jgi:hypothetical protein
MRQRVAAIVAVVLAPAVVGLAAYLVVVQFPRGLIVLACVMIALAAGPVRRRRCSAWRRSSATPGSTPACTTRVM